MTTLPSTKPTSASSALDNAAPRYSSDFLDYGIFPFHKDFSKEHSRWRKNVLKYVKKHDELFPLAALVSSEQQLRFMIDEEAASISIASRILFVLQNNQKQTWPSNPSMELELRVLQRLGLFTSLGFELARLATEKQQEVLSMLLPPETKPIVAAGLKLHAQQFCHLDKPLCQQCPINRFCTHFRKEEVAQAKTSGKPTIVDLFCGAGGLSDGFRRAGFRTILAIDHNPKALRTFKLNHPEVDPLAVVCQDLRDFTKDAQRIKELLNGQEVDVLVGGPPCQGFSRIGWRARGTTRTFAPSEDQRNHLYQEVITLLRLVKPKVVLMENVPGIGEVRFPDGASFQSVVEKAMQQEGYTPTTWTLNAAQYGVPQMRVRRVIIGTRLNSSSGAVAAPPPQYRAISRQYRHTCVVEQELFESLEDPITLFEAIGDLPPLGVDDGHWIDHHAPTQDALSSRYLQRYPSRHPLGLLFSHKTRYQNPSDLERFGCLRPGETYMDLIAQRPELQNYRTDAFDDKYYRLRPDKPSRTIVAHLRKDGNSFVHPTQVRSLSVREAARLQSFDDAYIFTGSRGDQFEQIGNAVPPLMAQAMAEAILKHLRVASFAASL